MSECITGNFYILPGHKEFFVQGTRHFLTESEMRNVAFNVITGKLEKSNTLTTKIAGCLLNILKASFIAYSALFVLDHLCPKKYECLRERITSLEELPNSLHRRIQDYTGSKRVADIALGFTYLIALSACRVIFDLSLGKMLGKIIQRSPMEQIKDDFEFFYSYDGGRLLGFSHWPSEWEEVVDGLKRAIEEALKSIDSRNQV